MGTDRPVSIRNDFVEEIGKVLRPSDEIWMKFLCRWQRGEDISANDLIGDLSAPGKAGFLWTTANVVNDGSAPPRRLRAAAADGIQGSCWKTVCPGGSNYNVAEQNRIFSPGTGAQ